MSLVSRLLLWSTFLVQSFHASARPQPVDLQLHDRQATDATGRPCGLLFDSIKDELSKGLFPLFFAADVYTCLISVPFLPAVAVRFLDYYNMTLQFQSTLAFLRDPPPGYQQPAVDVVAELERIRQNVLAGSYTKQYDFEVDVQKVVRAIHDSHVELVAGVLAPFTFASPFDIVSASLDGQALPKPYLKYDIVDAQNASWAWQPSPISTINGIPAVEYLSRFANEQSFGYVESHAEWNDLMENPTLDIQGVYGTFGEHTFYPGNGPDDTISIALENGTRYDDRWLSTLSSIHSPGPLETGGDFYNFFVLGLLPASFDPDDDTIPLFQALTETEVAANKGSWFEDSEGAYPEKPDVAQFDLAVAGGGVMSGYYLDDISTGVLSIPSFEQFPDEAKNFSAAVQEFIDKAKAKNIKRLLIDLQQNDGGGVNLVFDTFRRIFPREPESLPWSFGGSRRRSHQLGDLIGNVMTEWWKGLDDTDFDFWDEAGNEWNIATRIDAETNQTFADWAEYSPGETEYRGDRFSRVERYDLNDEAFLYSAFSLEEEEDDPYGYGGNPVKADDNQGWTPEDIVILTDGLCSSACSLFVEFMTRTGVKTVVAGGRPEPGPMQAVSGSRGSRGYSGEILDWIMKFAGLQDETANKTLPNIPIDYETRDSGMWVSFSGINLRDQIRKSDFDAGGQLLVPLQFQYEAAHCRIFYTVQNIYNLTQLWRDAAAAAWDPSLCVPGSTGYANSPNQPAANQPPPLVSTSSSDTSASSTGSDGGQRGGAGADDDGPPDFNENDIVAGFSVKSESLQPCNAGGQCPKNFQCRTVTVACDSNQRPTQRETQYCLPMCAGTQSDSTCNRFSSDPRATGPLQCKLTHQYETKAKADRGRQGYVGFCSPPKGIRATDLCVGA